MKKAECLKEENNWKVPSDLILSTDNQPKISVHGLILTWQMQSSPIAQVHRFMKWRQIKWDSYLGLWCCREKLQANSVPVRSNFLSLNMDCSICGMHRVPIYIFFTPCVLSLFHFSRFIWNFRVSWILKKSTWITADLLITMLHLSLGRINVKFVSFVSLDFQIIELETEYKHPW